MKYFIPFTEQTFYVKVTRNISEQGCLYLLNKATVFESFSVTFLPNIWSLHIPINALTACPRLHDDILHY